MISPKEVGHRILDLRNGFGKIVSLREVEPTKNHRRLPPSLAALGLSIYLAACAPTATVSVEPLPPTPITTPEMQPTPTLATERNQSIITYLRELEEFLTPLHNEDVAWNPEIVPHNVFIYGETSMSAVMKAICSGCMQNEQSTPLPSHWDEGFSLQGMSHLTILAALHDPYTNEITTVLGTGGSFYQFNDSGTSGNVELDDLMNETGTVTVYTMLPETWTDHVYSNPFQSDFFLYLKEDGTAYGYKN